MPYARVEPIIALLVALALPVITQATDFDDCATAAGGLKEAAEDADRAKRAFDSAKDDYESACSSYGYDRNNRYACGPYGYHYTELEDAKSRLERAKSSLDSAHESTNGRCGGDPRQSAFLRLAQKLDQENKQLRSQLRECQGTPSGNTSPPSNK